jgi:Sec-independent protein translocase protein TatA
MLTFKKWDEETYNSLPKWIQDIIKVSPEFKKLNQPQAKDEYQNEKKQNPLDPYAKVKTDEADKTELDRLLKNKVEEEIYLSQDIHRGDEV